MFEVLFQTRVGTLNVGSSAGSGKAPLVLLHGVTRRWQTFMPLAASLGLRHSLQAIDFHGHGKTPPVAGRYRVVDYAADAIAFVESQPPQPVIIYGHSLGAMVAAIVAAERPDRVAAVVMEDPPFHTMGRRIGQTLLLSFFTSLRAFASDPRPGTPTGTTPRNCRFSSIMSG